MQDVPLCAVNVSLQLVNKETSMAYGRTECSQVGNQSIQREREKDGGEIDMPAATLWNQDVR